MNPVRILLVDDNPEFLAASGAYLRKLPHLQIRRTAASGEDALTLCTDMVFDLALVDLHMRGLNGLETTRRLKALPGAPKVIVVTLMEAPEYRQLAFKAGADGFLAKSAFTKELLPLIATLFPADSRP